MLQEIKQDANERMNKSLESLRGELKKMRTGRAHTSLLDHITVDYYGSEVPSARSPTSASRTRARSASRRGTSRWCRRSRRPS
jgi:ribosome recycling factor